METKSKQKKARLWFLLIAMTAAFVLSLSALSGGFLNAKADGTIPTGSLFDVTADIGNAYGVAAYQNVNMAGTPAGYAAGSPRGGADIFKAQINGLFEGNFALDFSLINLVSPAWWNVNSMIDKVSFRFADVQDFNNYFDLVFERAASFGGAILGTGHQDGEGQKDVVYVIRGADKSYFSFEANDTLLNSQTPISSTNRPFGPYLRFGTVYDYEGSGEQVSKSGNAPLKLEFKKVSGEWGIYAYNANYDLKPIAVFDGATGWDLGGADFGFEGAYTVTIEMDRQDGLLYHGWSTSPYAKPFGSTHPNDDTGGTGIIFHSVTDNGTVIDLSGIAVVKPAFFVAYENYINSLYGAVSAEDLVIAGPGATVTGGKANDFIMGLTIEGGQGWSAELNGVYTGDFRIDFSFLEFAANGLKDGEFTIKFTDAIDDDKSFEVQYYAIDMGWGDGSWYTGAAMVYKEQTRTTAVWPEFGWIFDTKFIDGPRQKPHDSGLGWPAFGCESIAHGTDQSPTGFLELKNVESGLMEVRRSTRGASMVLARFDGTNAINQGSGPEDGTYDLPLLNFPNGYKVSFSSQFAGNGSLSAGTDICIKAINGVSLVWKHFGTPAAVSNTNLALNGNSTITLAEGGSYIKSDYDFGAVNTFNLNWEGLKVTGLTKTVYSEDEVATFTGISTTVLNYSAVYGSNTVTRTVKVTDQTAPVISINGGNTCTVTYGSVGSAPGSTVSDNVDTGLAATSDWASVITNTTAAGGPYTVTYTVKDAANNTGTATLTVTIQKAEFKDTTATAAATFAPGLKVKDIEEVSVLISAGYTFANAETVLFAGAGQSFAGTKTSADPNYVTERVTVTISVSKASASITADATQSVTYDGGDKSVTASVSNGQDGSLVITYYESSADRESDTDGSTSGPSAVGVYYVRITYAGDANYNAAAYADVTFTINSLPTPVITADAAQSAAYDGTAKNITASISDGLTAVITYYASENDRTNGINALSGAPTNAGVYYVKVSFGGNSEYNAAVSVNVTFTINKATPVITAAATQSAESDGTAKSITASISNGLTVVITYYTSENDRTAGTNALSGAPTDVGTYYVKVSFAGNDNYNAVSANVTFNITEGQTSKTGGCGNVSFGGGAGGGIWMIGLLLAGFIPLIEGCRRSRRCGSTGFTSKP